MKKIDDGGLAFPGRRCEQVGNVSDHGFTFDGEDSPTFADVLHGGMSLRDWFAGQALAGLNGWVPGHQFGLSDPEGIKARSEWAYAHADAMIAARTASPHSAEQEG